MNKTLLMSDEDTFDLKLLTATVNKLCQNQVPVNVTKQPVDDLELCELRDFIQPLNKVFIDVQIKDTETSFFNDNRIIFFKRGDDKCQT